MDNNAGRLSPEEQDILTLIGVTLTAVQRAERNIGYCINFVFQSGPVITLDGLDALEEDAKRKTLGQLIQSLRMAITVPETFDQDLRSFLDNRNRFIHRLVHEPEFNMDSSQGRKNLWSFLIRFCNQMLSMNKMFLGFLGGFAVDIGIASFSSDTPLGDLFRHFSESSDYKLVIRQEHPE